MHCKCEECKNTPEDGLPPPPRAHGGRGAAAAAAAAATVADIGNNGGGNGINGPTDSNKTSPGTPPAYVLSPCCVALAYS